MINLDELLIYVLVQMVNLGARPYTEWLKSWYTHTHTHTHKHTHTHTHTHTHVHTTHTHTHIHKHTHDLTRNVSRDGTNERYVPEKHARVHE